MDPWEVRDVGLPDSRTRRNRTLDFPSTALTTVMVKERGEREGEMARAATGKAMVIFEHYSSINLFIQLFI